MNVLRNCFIGFVFLFFVGNVYAAQQIEGSSRNIMEVNDENQAVVHSTAESEEHHVNERHEEAYHVEFETWGDASDDAIFFMQNTKDNQFISVEGFAIRVSSATSVYFKLDDAGTRNSATDATPVNVASGSGNDATGNFEVGRDLDGGSATLSGGAIMHTYWFPTADKTEFVNFEMDVILRDNKTLTIWAGLTGVTVNVTIPFYYHKDEGTATIK